MNEKDLAKIREASEKDTIEEACSAMEKVLLELGYYMAVPKQ